ncbi:MAG: cysteine--tRNA ligase [Chloroflexi bacterium]|nr:cysteine--tRNA ligase [Chloroflexota bacterium]
MALRVYNTLTRSKEEFVPRVPGKVSMYVCGPTVYASAHIGHAMSYLVFDVIRRYLEYSGYEVDHVENFTDIDDKIIARAQQLGETASELAMRYEGEYLEDMDALGIRRPNVYAHATVEIPRMIQVIEGLIDKGYAYVLEGDVYFRVTRDEDYGKLSRRSLEDMMAGGRVEIDPRKEHPMDFALWKSAKPGEPSWESPWGPGRPGWHIECSTIIMHHLGDQIDIHGGGQDLIFPHHENEIAQAESFSEKKPFVKYWLHNGLLELGGEKMAKSVGNLITIKEIVEHFDPDALRLLVLSSHYRSPLTYTEESLDSAARGLMRLKTPILEGLPTVPEAKGGVDLATAPLESAVDRIRSRFVEAMDDDFNTPQALAQLFELTREINRAKEQGALPEAILDARETLLELGGILGLQLAKPVPQARADIAPFVELLISVRQDLRVAKQWALADRIRDELSRLGVALEDRPAGTGWRFDRS